MNYVRLALVGSIAIVIVALCGAVLYYRGASIAAELRQKTAENNLTQAREVNSENAKALERLAAQLERDGRLIAAFSERISDITATTAKVTESLAALERANADVANYLSLVLPDDLVRLLNPGAATDRANGNNSPAASPGAGPTMPEADRKH